MGSDKPTSSPSCPPLTVVLAADAAASSPNTNDREVVIDKRRRMGICIRCGVKKTHIRNMLRRMIPIDNHPCYRQGYCRQCFPLDDIVCNFNSNNNSSSIRNSSTNNEDESRIPFSPPPSSSGGGGGGGCRSSTRSVEDMYSPIIHDDGTVTSRSSRGGGGGEGGDDSASSGLSYRSPPPPSPSPSPTIPNKNHPTIKNTFSTSTMKKSRTEIWNPPMIPPKFPSPLILPGIRNAVVDVLLYEDQKRNNNVITKESVYLIRQRQQQGSCSSSSASSSLSPPPQQAYRKLRHMRPVKMSRNEGSIIFCLVLLQCNNHQGGISVVVYEEPPPDNDSYEIVAVKKYSKFQIGWTTGKYHPNGTQQQQQQQHHNNNSFSSSFSSMGTTSSSSRGCRSSSGGSGSGSIGEVGVGGAGRISLSEEEGNTTFRKEAWVLQHLGKHGKGILQCKDVLEDEKYIYVVCELPRFGPLEHALPGAPLSSSSSQNHHLSRRRPNYKREKKIKILFRQLLNTVGRMHFHGLCHGSLSLTTILWAGDDDDDGEEDNHDGNDYNNSMTVNGNGTFVSTGTIATTESFVAIAQQQQQNKKQISRHHDNCFASQLFVDDFSLSLKLPTSLSLDGTTIQRHWIQPQENNVYGGVQKEYLPPEVYGRQPFDGPAADIWSLGVILFNLLTGTKLYDLPCRLDQVYYYMIDKGGLTDDDSNEKLLDVLYEHDRPSSSSTSSFKGRKNRLMDIILSLQMISFEARQLLQGMLQVDPCMRLTTEEALQHRWFQWRC